MFVWDEAKRRLNLRKHGIDFMDAEKIFRGVTFTAEDDSAAHGEQRFLTLGLLEDSGGLGSTHGTGRGDSNHFYPESHET